MFRERLLSKRLRLMAESFPVVVVSGARQVGKTTLVRHLFPQMDYVVFDPTLDIENARREPDLFLRNHPSPLVLDEIQYAPELVAALKRRVDAAGAKHGQYVLTGSQQWQVMRSLSESLAGRAAFLDLEGFSLQELEGRGNKPGWLQTWLDTPEEMTAGRGPRDAGSGKSPLEWLWRGQLPGVQPLAADLVTEFWTGYQRTYIERDARLAGDVGDWQQFGLFIRLAGALTAQEVNYSHLGREIGMTPQSARRWLQTMRGTFQWVEVPAFKGNVVKRVSSKPKGYLADTGLACHLAMITSPKTLSAHPLLGALFETAMVHEVRKQLYAGPGRATIHHWRSAGGAEVDLLVERDGVFYPFEIKLTAHPTRRDASGITAFREAHPKIKVGKGAILCAAERRLWITEDMAAIPWNQA
jgi:predicted AAA+ superfamily ATPase